ncbi:MAG: hypothetical protein ACFFEY_10375 [Candidatus Thorarchaeota archaeon]
MLVENKFMIILIGIMSLLILLLTPYGIDIDLGPGPNRLLAILWELLIFDVFSWFTAFEYFPIYFFRFIAAYYVIRYISGAVSRKKAIIMSVVSELIPLIILIPGVLILDPSGHNYLPIMIPIPILLLYNLSLIFIFSNKKLKLKELS